MTECIAAIARHESSLLAILLSVLLGVILFVAISAFIHLASDSPSYSPRRITQLPAVPDTVRAALMTSRGSPIYSSRLTRYRARRRRPHCQPPHRYRSRRVLLAIVVAASYSSCRTHQHTRHVLLAIVLAAGVPTAT